MRGVLLCLLLGSAAWAEDDIELRARARAEAGRTLYRAGMYREAIREFTAGYELAALPAFLINVGQCYRQLGDLENARGMFEKFLIEAPGDAPERPMVKRLLDTITLQLREQREASPAPVAQPPPPIISGEVPRQSPAPTVAAVIAQPPPPQKSFVRRHWWIFPVIGVAAAGLAVGIYFAARPAGIACDDPSVTSCITVR
jgi:tetratricopeptide (TPR) repeat protein